MKLKEAIEMYEPDECLYISGGSSFIFIGDQRDALKNMVIASIERKDNEIAECKHRYKSLVDTYKNLVDNVEKRKEFEYSGTKEIERLEERKKALKQEIDKTNNEKRKKALNDQLTAVGHDLKKLVETREKLDSRYVTLTTREAFYAEGLERSIIYLSEFIPYLERELIDCYKTTSKEVIGEREGIVLKFDTREQGMYWFEGEQPSYEQKVLKMLYKHMQNSNWKDNHGDASELFDYMNDWTSRR